MLDGLFPSALLCLQADDIDCKLAQVSTLQHRWKSGELDFRMASSAVIPIPDPGRPPKPALVSALLVEKRKLSTSAGIAALIHALAHIEFNAINLALDAVYRFRDLPHDYYDDWLRVAAEEAYHFSLLRAHLLDLGYDYGDFTAHNGLWDMAVATAHDPLVRMALVPRVLEARGLDALPAIIHKLTSVGATDAAKILTIILHDEIGHVAVGNRWYAYLCAQQGVEPVATFRRLLREYHAPKPRKPLHTAARLAAGFSQAEMDMLTELAN